MQPQPAASAVYGPPKRKPSIASRYGAEPAFPAPAPLPVAIPRPEAAVCGDCSLWRPLAIAGAVAGRCIRQDGRPGIIGRSVTACGKGAF